MAVTEEKLKELFEQLNSDLENVNFADDSATYGTSHSLYGAVPTVSISGGSTASNWTTNNTAPTWTFTTGGTTNAGMPTWQTTGTGYTIGTATQPNIEQGGKIHIKGKNADLVIGDKSMRAWMEQIEERLNILTPNPELEKEWDELRRLGERYRKLEKKCQQKSDMWNRLKSLPKSDC